MPRKVRVPASKEESREAQQRSRARHREYVANLEQRVSDYEKRGVNATQEMQRAARAVAWKNERLLVLLALHGVQHDEIDAFLAAPEAVGNPSQSQVRYTSTTPTGPSPAITQPDSDSMAPSVNISVVNVPSYHQNVKDTACSKVASCGPAGPGVGYVETRTCRPFPEQSSGSAPASVSACSSSQVTSCEAAASIIMNLRGHGDVTEARQTLGCTDSNSCSVKNTDLFQIMNEMP
ncbi:hypothetical protein BKA67DRAFT_541024 [Truncatella angustata]|uniref:BZIP domain-containing protein n=1 Tax=Truncatella angustata TaxID=152316 RepID=A0A9P8RKM0_9PEZI|nr:uncharacterized protein BKA67DRAFT_541024 [Truncatella angustata]KAH6646033.1 hypothetical protein BKA67DRAFT_541024 [Truncatella angustata]